MPFFSSFGSKKKSKSSSNLNPDDQSFDSQQTGGWLHPSQHWAGQRQHWDVQGIKELSTNCSKNSNTS